ncbi:hypothetical protein GCM10020001_003410 [Nonomuraea salmonea]
MSTIIAERSDGIEVEHFYADIECSYGREDESSDDESELDQVLVAVLGEVGDLDLAQLQGGLWVRTVSRQPPSS